MPALTGAPASGRQEACVETPKQLDTDDRYVAKAVVSSTTLGQTKQSSAAMATAGW
jgi:hypothetical protein